MKRLLILTTWLFTTTITLFTTVTLYQTINQTKGINELVNNQINTFAKSDNAVMAYAALPSSIVEVRTAVLGADARPVTIDAYFKAYKSPLQGYGEFIVKTADEYDIDPYLIVAISQQESNLCKIIPDDSYNCWGWGVHKSGTLRFDDYQDAILDVTQGLKEEYFDKGYNTPERIMTKYTPLSNGSWAAGINQFLDELNSGNF